MEQHQNTEQPQREKDVPDVVQEEPNDKPAGRGVLWAVFIVIAILAAVYFLFFWEGGDSI